jgi:hypothetical protein
MGCSPSGIFPAHPGESRDPGRIPGLGGDQKNFGTENTENTDDLRSITERRAGEFGP